MQRAIRFAVVLACSAAHAAAAQAGASADTSGGKSNVLPVVEIASFLTLLSAYDRVAYANEMQDGKRVYSATIASTWYHLRTQRWVHDQDPFNVNQFEHPYQGAMMYGLARSSGHTFWASLADANIGSFIWKMAGETDPPSINDMITTGQAGSLLGEALYRVADLVLKDKPAGGKSPRWHDYVADAISPPRAVNRRVFGEHFRAELPDSTPATSWQVRLGASLDAVAHNTAVPGTLLNRGATAELWLSYGLPGKPGYAYTRPLDYFDPQMSK